MAVQSDMIAAIYQIADERGLSHEVVLKIIKDAVLAAYTKAYGEADNLSVDLDEENGKFVVYAEQLVVKKVEDEKKEISVAEATGIDKSLKEGDRVLADITPEGFGRIAAQAARMKIVQDIREAEHTSQLEKLQERMGQIVSGVVQRPIRGGVIEVEVDRATTWMPEDEQIPREFYKSGERMRFLLKEIREIDSVQRAIVSRGSEDFLKKLFETEIPEVNSGVVEIKKITREPGSRTKVAVYSNQEKIDPIGACVGPRGARIGAISEELGMREKIDIIVWDEDPSIFVRNALQPATPIDVKVDTKTEHAVVLVAEDILSLAIGKEGQNARLAAKLTGYKIDITDQEKEFKKMKGVTASEVEQRDRDEDSGSPAAVAAEVADRAKGGNKRKKTVAKDSAKSGEKAEKKTATKKSAKSVKSAKAKKTTAKKGEFVCEKCGKTYKTKSGYEKHSVGCER